MNEESSSFYPPRSRGFVSTFRGRVSDEIESFLQLKFRKLIPSLLLPCYSFFAFKVRKLGWIATGIYLASLLIFLVFLGHRISTMAYATMSSIHTCSIIFLLTRWKVMSRIKTRIVISLGVMAVVWMVIYSPVINLMNRCWVAAFYYNGHVILSRGNVEVDSLQPKDVVIYQIASHSRNAGVYAGNDYSYNVDPIIGLPGDRISFTKDAFYVNEVPFEKQSYMPGKFQIEVPVDHFFIWPASAHKRANNNNAEQAGQNFVKWGIVPKNNILGRPYEHWFGRDVAVK